MEEEDMIFNDDDNIDDDNKSVCLFCEKSFKVPNFGSLSAYLCTQKQESPSPGRKKSLVLGKDSRKASVSIINDGQ